MRESKARAGVPSVDGDARAWSGGGPTGASGRALDRFPPILVIFTVIQVSSPDMSNRRNSIPPNAKKVFAGTIFDVYQWEQKLFDGSVKTFERLKRPDTAQVIATVGDKILVQSEEQPDTRGSFTSLPGGRQDPGESPLKSAKRELLEETGCVSDDWQLWNEVQPVGKIDWTVHTFIAHNCTQAQDQRTDAGERITVRPVSFDEFLLLADDPLFYSPEIVSELLRMRLDQDQKEAFRTLLFGRNA
jgi:ADP-ribose pyrophosphatase